MGPERRAVFLLLSLAVLGQGLRVWIGRPGTPPGEVQLFTKGFAEPAPGRPTLHGDSGRALARPLGRGERIDLDRATELEIARLPRVGLSLARTIVQDRAAHGPFGSLEGLDRVPGVGPGLLRTIADHVSFSGRPVEPPPAGILSGPRPVTVNVNTADVRELERLPFIGPSLARRIVESRERHGSFPAVDSLVRVPGLGPGLLGKLRDLVRVSD